MQIKTKIRKIELYLETKLIFIFHDPFLSEPTLDIILCSARDFRCRPMVAPPEPSLSANPIFRKNDAIIGFLGFGSKFSGVISPDHSVRLAFSVKIRSFSTTNLAGKELEKRSSHKSAPQSLNDIKKLHCKK